MNGSEAGVKAYLGYLQSLRESKTEYFLEGGQAVNFWAEYINAHIQGKPLSSMYPFTSKDCDIWVSFYSWEKLKRNPAVQKSSSPADGQLGILTLSKEPPLIVDILQTVYGIDVHEYPRLVQRALDDGTIRVIDPIYLFLSKCHCFLHLPQADRQDERHVRMLAMILPEYISLLIDDADQGSLPDRDLLKEIKLLKKISSLAACRRSMQSLGIQPQTLIPWDRLARSQSDLLVKYAKSQSNKDE